MKQKVVAVVATLDTKGEEVAYLRDRIRGAGKGALVIDVGVLNPPRGITPDISAQDVAARCGMEFKEMVSGGRGRAVANMAQAAAKVVSDLWRSGQIHGVLSVGGAQGTFMGTQVMKALPVGVPKVMLSTMAAGRQTFGEYVGTKDIAMIHSVVDILGINSVSRKILDNAAGAICGMVDLNSGSIEDCARDTSTLRVAAMMYGNTTPAVMKAKEILEAAGYEVVVFHSNGTGGPAMEELIRQGIFHGVLDVTTHEVTDYLFGGFHSGGPDRLEAAGEAGIPQLVVPGCVEFIIQGPLDTLPERYKARQYYVHNPLITVVSTTREEIDEVGKVMAEKLNRAKGPTKVAIPLQGLSAAGHKTGPLHDPERDRVLFGSLKSHLRPEIEVIEVDAHINDPEFAEVIAAEFTKMMRDAYPASHAG